MDRQQEFVLRTLEERDIRFVRLWFTDVLGFLKSVAVAPAELEGAFSDGIGFDGSAIEGFARVYESDMVAKPDPSTFQVLPWETPEGGHYSARMFCDIAMPDGSPSWADPRHVLRRQLSKAGEAGFTCYVHPEIEFFLLSTLPEDGTEPEPADNGGYFDQASHATATHFRRHAIETLEAMGISVEFSHHEGAPGQQEIDLRYADALTMADNVMTFRYVIKEVALTQGVRATFMPKPFTAQPGSGMHTHVSLFEGDRNAFHNPEDPFELSDTGKAFVAGLLFHAREISAVTNQWVNSYKRLISGGEAPTTVSWGRANRSALVRVPNYSPGKASSRRVEIRTIDSACNPYLTYSVVLAAGLKGIEKGYELPPPAEDNIWSLTDAERRAAGYDQLPQNLGEALTEMERSELLPEALGEHVYDFFLRNKRVEWDNYRSAVTPYELRTLLPVL
ncbi:type I glutamate--ammonia ligase [Amycolatopsis acidicola]|uniref:Type I glutamate--ammonia ligase n=1 Tax=Amycolatopsis acidicola TaxID=2596893 RepID=A0A5N0UK99_9PSEU|nr:type I glutamate--ammonia ligase [Amycolatopsis acidicola]KAA9147826.1 type I glutamate--ammonia ligase [Amycolatopsis acidicola]